VECYDDMICRWAIELIVWNTDNIFYKVVHIIQEHIPQNTSSTLILVSIKFSHKCCYTLPNPNTLTHQVIPAR
jgi:hypothetical protein